MSRSAVVDSSPRFRSARARRRAGIALAVMLAGGLVTTFVVLIPNTTRRLNTPISSVPAQTVSRERPVPPDPVSKTIGRKFIETAVLRKNLDWAYDHVHSYLKGRETRAEWDSGNIAVIPYPAVNAATTAFLVDYSYRTEVLYEVELNAKAGSGIRPMLFFLGLRRQGDRPTGRWLVSYWQPHWRPPVPYSG